MQHPFIWTQPLNALKGGQTRLIAVGAIALLGIGTGYYVVQNTAASPEPTQTVAAPVTAVTALGRLEPEGGVIKLSVASAQDSRVDQLLVEEGDTVEAGEVIAILQGLDKRQAALAEAEKNLGIVQAKLAQAQAGDAKTAELAAQQANIARLEAQLSNETLQREAEMRRAETELETARASYQRYLSLHQAGAISTEDLDEQRRRFETAQADLDAVQAQQANTVATLQRQIQQQEAVLNQLQEVRPVDVQIVQAELEYAQTQVAKAQADLDDLYVRVPVDGQILKVNTRVGEQVSTSEGIVELAQTDQMYAIAEVYETDINQVQLGQPVTILSENGGFDGKIQGTVDHIGLQIGKQDILDSDPAADKDARVVEVKVRIDPEDSPKVAGLTNLQVRVQIHLDK